MHYELSNAKRIAPLRVSWLEIRDAHQSMAIKYQI